MPTSNQITGTLGETLARQYLEKKGFTIIQTNYHSRFGEIDIIAKSREEVDWLIFVEVKTRTYENPRVYGYAEELVDFVKQNKLLATANYYMDQKNINPDHWRLDVIVIDLNPETRRAKIRHYDNI